MGNIANIWYVKGQGGSWCETKCDVDHAVPNYAIPYQNGDEFYPYVYIPSGYQVGQVMLIDNAGNAIQDILPDTEFKKIVFEDTSQYFQFRMPTYGEQKCIQIANGSEERCTLTLQDVLDYISGFGDPTAQNVWNEYLANTPGSYVTIQFDLGIEYMIPGYPPEFTAYYPYDQDTPKWFVPCYEMVSDTYISFNFYSGNSIVGQSGDIPTSLLGKETVQLFTVLECFTLEIPLLQDGVEVARLSTEPFTCNGCGNTVVISSDYCKTATDIDDNMIFDPTGMGIEQSGSMGRPKNNIRIQAILKQKPSRIEKNRSVRCNTFSATKTKQYKIQGFMTDFPPYIMNLIENILAGKTFYIDGDEYLDTQESIFQERNVQGYSMFKLEGALELCRKRRVYPCPPCTEQPPNCEENPVGGFVYALPATSFNTLDNNNEFGANQVYWKAGLVSVVGGEPPLEIFDWQFNNGTPVTGLPPYTDFNDNSDTNYFKRTDYDQSSISVLVKVRDARGCVYQFGNSVSANDLTCVEDEGMFTVMLFPPAGSTTITITPDPSLPVADMEYSFDGVNWIDAGVNSPTAFNVTGLTSNTEYEVYLRISCNGGMNYGTMGKLVIKTL